MRALLLSLLLIVAAGPSPAAAWKATLSDHLCQQPALVTEPGLIVEQGDTLHAVLLRVSKCAGVRLKTYPPLSEVRVTVRYEGALQGFMDALAQFAAVDKDHPARWRRGATGSFILERGPRALQALQALKLERHQELVQALEGSLCTQHPATLPLKILDQQHRGVVYAGGTVEVNPGVPHWAELRKELLPHGDWPASTKVEVGLAGKSRQLGRLAWCWRDDERGCAQEESVWLSEVAPELGASYDRKRWAWRFGDSLLPGRQPPCQLFASGEARRGSISRGALLLRVAERAKANVIAEDHGQQLDLSTFANCDNLPALLDKLCEPIGGSQEAPGFGVGYYWRQAKDTYLLRNLDWPEVER